MTQIKQDKFQGHERISLENEKISISILPQIGGKMISLTSKKTGKEFMSLSGRKFTRPIYGTGYGEFDISGFDECFPGIGEGFYPEWPWKGAIIPDHGEVFTLPWECKAVKNKLAMTVYGIRFPYKFYKIVSLEKNAVHIEYELENLSPYDFKYIWSAHPLFSVSQGTTILFPGTPGIRTDYSKHERFGKVLYETSWPTAKQADGKVVDLSRIRSAKEDAATKVFTTKLEDGWCGLRYPDDVILKMTFPVEQVPYVGLWINEGGWPVTGKRSFNVAMEPCTGCPDKLETAIQRNECAVVNGKGKNSWYLQIAIEEAK